MATPKSPFFIVEEFISPLMCEDMIDLLDYNVPDYDKEGKEVLTRKTCERAEEIIYERFFPLIPTLEQYYNLKYKGKEDSSFEWYPEGTAGELHAENSKYLRKKWVRVFPADLTGVLFLSDYQENTPFESDFEVYGGKLEFPQHHFSFNPKRGTLVIFPSDPHFINVTSPVKVGDLFQARFNVVAQSPLLYNGQDFPGNYTQWFKDHL